MKTNETKHKKYKNKKKKQTNAFKLISSSSTTSEAINKIYYDYI